MLRRNETHEKFMKKNAIFKKKSHKNVRKKYDSLLADLGKYQACRHKFVQKNTKS